MIASWYEQSHPYHEKQVLVREWKRRQLGVFRRFLANLRDMATSIRARASSLPTRKLQELHTDTVPRGAALLRGAGGPIVFTIGHCKFRAKSINDWASSCCVDLVLREH